MTTLQISVSDSKSTFDKVILLIYGNTMKVTQKGQITIPKKYRDRFFLKTNTRVSFEEKEDGILIKPIVNSGLNEIKVKIEKFAGIADKNLSTEQIMSLTRD